MTRATTTNKIFYGPPGTGKTWRLVEEALALALEPAELDQLRNTGRSALQQRFDALCAQGIIELVTFHPSYTYEDFVEGLRPLVTDEEQVIYEVVPGVLRRIAARAELLHQEVVRQRQTSSQQVPVHVPPLHLVWSAFLDALAEARSRYELDGVISPLIQEQRSGRRVDYDAGADAVQVASRAYEQDGKVRKTRVMMSDLERAWHHADDSAELPRELFKKYSTSSGHDTDIRLVYMKLKDFWRKHSTMFTARSFDLTRAWDALIAHYTRNPVTLTVAAQTLKIGAEREGAQTRIVVSSADGGFPQKALTSSELDGWLREYAPGASRPSEELTEPLKTLFTGAVHHRPALAQVAANIYGTLRQLASALPAPAPPPAPRACVLIIDEINRGNIAKIFGELMTIVEPSRRLGAAEATRVRLPLAGDDPEALFGLPANLHLLGTMNTADRSIALMDVALRRRFEFVEVMPQPSLLRHHLPAEVGALAAALLTTLNERIGCLLDRDHLIGHAALMGATSPEDLRDWLVTQVIPLLQEYFYGDWSRVALVLGCPFDQRGLPVDTKTDARLLVPQGGSTAQALFYNQWRDPAPLRLMVNPALASATGDALNALLRGVLTPDQRGL